MSSHVLSPPTAIRPQFPALSRTHGGLPVAYFDGPGGTQVPRAVVEAMTDYLYHHNANTHWAYPTSEETDRLLAGGQGGPRRLPERQAAEIVFGAEHDHADVPPRARARAWPGAPATRSWSPTWTTMPTGPLGAAGPRAGRDRPDGAIRSRHRGARLGTLERMITDPRLGWSRSARRPTRWAPSTT